MGRDTLKPKKQQQYECYYTNGIHKRMYFDSKEEAGVWAHNEGDHLCEFYRSDWL